MDPRSRTPHVLLLVAATAVGPLALNIVLPLLPGLVTSFATDAASVQMTMASYLIAISLAQLIYGPLSDRFGRRPVLLAGLALFALASVLCAVAWSIEMLILGRALQGIGGCAGMVLSRAIIRDVYGREKSASLIGYVTMGMAVAPMIAPSLGAMLAIWFDWRASFVVLLVSGFGLLAWAMVALHETNHHRQALPGIAGLASGYVLLLRSRVYICYALGSALASAAFFGFLGGAPYLTINVLHEPGIVFGLAFVFVSIAYMAGNFVAGRYSERRGVERMVMLGAWISVAGGAAALATGLFGALSVYTIFGPMLLVALGNGISLPNGIAGAISVNPRAAGTASGLMGCLQMAAGGFANWAVGSLQGTTAYPMVIAIALATGSSLLAYWLATRLKGPPATGPRPSS